MAVQYFLFRNQLLPPIDAVIDKSDVIAQHMSWKKEFFEPALKPVRDFGEGLRVRSWRAVQWVGDCTTKWHASDLPTIQPARSTGGRSWIRDLSLMGR